MMGQVTEQDQWHLEYFFRLPLMKWQEDDNLLVGKGQLVQQNLAMVEKWRDSLAGCLRGIAAGERKQKGIFLVLTGLLFRQLEKDYRPLAKRYLVKVLENMELHYGSDCPYLRGALRVYEAKNIKPSQLARKL